MREHLDDPYVKKAQKDGYRARAAYKLLEMQEKYKIIKPGMTVVDLGAAPGSWSQIAGKLVGDKGLLIASDILPMDALPDVTFLQGDFREESVLQQLQDILQGQKADVVVSDMAPNLSGVESADSARVAHLIELALEFAQQHMKPEGTLVTKVFHGSGYSQLVELFKQYFVTVKPFKPKASRDKSAETFLVGMKLKHPSA